MENSVEAQTNIADSSNILNVAALRIQELAPRPTQLSDTGLSESFITDLIAKHIMDGGVLTMTALSERIALAGPILESVLNFMRHEALIEIRGKDSASASNNLRYALTDRGRVHATDALSRSGYIGPAPVPVDKYIEVTKAQTVHGRAVNRDEMAEVFKDIIIRDDLIEKLGPSLNSGRAIFIYGPAGTGKTFITQHLVGLFPEATLVPYAISVNEVVIEVFDPVLHRPADIEMPDSSLMFDNGFDPRFACCQRPVVISGGELTADMLEIHYDANTRRYQAPLQLKANNGVFIIDDMGRQRVAPETVFNRWIVPLEEKKDYLNLGAGRHFSIPFDVVLIFSTNLHPLDLADDAFLRRIGYKIEFQHLNVEEFQMIWNQYCEQNDIQCEPEVFDFAVIDLYSEHRKAFLPCHPRDLLSIAVDRAVYTGGERIVNNEHLQWAWNNYFVSMNPGHVSRQTSSSDGER
jgi:predicted ATPase with chaperone activity